VVSVPAGNMPISPTRPADDTVPTMRRHAQELTDDVMLEHVDLYVNEWTEDLGDAGRAALRMLSRQAAHVGLLPAGTRALIVF